MNEANGRILLAHGAGGRLTHELIESLFVRRFDNKPLAALDDSAELKLPDDCRIAFTTDGYVVKPIEFPGGDIGRIAVCGTVNDLAMLGARPLGLSVALILEEGLERETLNRIVDSMADAAKEAGVELVTGDTKVVERGAASGLYIVTSGVGMIPYGLSLSGRNARVGDAVLVSGTLGDHGITVMNAREGLGFEGDLRSDAAPLNGLVENMLSVHSSVRVLRDLTRGGLATALNEISRASGVLIEIEETAVPVRNSVLAGCQMLGLDPLYVANEGKLVAMVDETYASGVLRAMRDHPRGREAVRIGTVLKGEAGVVMRTPIGGARRLLMLDGDPLPRIC
ncbi:MAG: hydrogenase expression/formation protein HypE [Candidatus Lindowbacteria bacterium RIFCSPLOWO2_12_FULL_62_27]|nr:MAG: hydrogenase expression/formation protein HypE [Candidatus Lindowbacteria bacterium RIFCSPLOWO2_12_FULL_62_27]